MNSAELLNAALRVYRQLGWTYLRLTLIPSVFCLAGMAFVLDYVLPSLFVTRDASSFATQIGEAGSALAFALFVGCPLFLIGCSYTCALVIHLTSDHMLGNPLSPDAAAQAARGSFGSLLLVAVREVFLSSWAVLASCLVLGVGSYLSQTHISSDLGGLLFGIGILGIAVGLGVFVLVAATHALAPAIVLLEGLTGFKAAKRSAYLLKPHLYHPSGVPNILVSLFYIGLAGLIEWISISGTLAMLQAEEHFQGLLAGVPFEGVFLSAFGLLAPFVTVWTLLPVYATCVTLVYYERRIRLEGLDIEILAAETQRDGAANRFDV